jgi:hypothetical protein
MEMARPIPIETYKSIIGAFLDQSIPIDEFEAQYNALILRDSGSHTEAEFRILNRLFAELDAYSPEIAPGKETNFLISERELRRQAAIALEQLDKLK